jgi:outer membrane translocation and assembly module TamA
VIKKINHIVGLVMILFLGSCTIFNKIPPGRSYFKDHRVELHGKNPLDIVKEDEINKSELLSLAKVEPNRKLVFFRLNMRIHTWFVPNGALARSMKRADARCARKNERRLSKGKNPTTCNSFWGWLAYTVGEPPVLLDSLKIEKSADQMTAYLKKTGYFSAKVRPTYSFGINQRWIKWKKNECTVTYHVYAGEASFIGKIEHSAEDAKMQHLLSGFKGESILKTGDKFNVNVLDNERDKMTTYFNNNGYFDFTKDYIIIEADSTASKNKIDIKYIIKEPIITQDGKDKKVPHRQYSISNIYIHTDYNPISLPTVKDDTLQYENLKIHFHQANHLKPKLLAYTNSLEKGKLYSKEKLDLTYKRFGQLGVTKNVYISLTPKNVLLPDGTYALDAHINLNPAQRQSLMYLQKVTNRSGYAGIFANMAYHHRNLFGGAENLDIRILTGFEASQLLGATQGSAADENIQNNFKLNTFEVGPQIALTLPRLFPFSYGVSDKSSEPLTTIQATYNFQTRPDYERYLTQVSIDWSFIENPDKRSKFNIEWAEFSIIKIDKSTSFENYIASFNDQFLANSYQNHFIAASKIGITVNTQKNKFQRFYYYYNGLLLEGAGNTLRGMYNWLSPQTKDEQGSYEIKEIRFAQYLKSDHDIRLYFSADPRNTVVLRAFGGCAMPLKNLESIPFEKSYFVGGSNGIRAWQARTLGVGSYRDTINAISFNNIGDIKLEFNLEYRFKINKKIQPAFFVDAGNIWLFREDTSRPNAQFDPNRFYKEIAVGAGAGLRLDFDFFIVRLDAGIPLKDPQKIEGERWAWQKKNEYNAFVSHYFGNDTGYNLKPVVNFGIGFPF